MQKRKLKVLKSNSFLVFNFYEKKIDAVNDLPDDRHRSGKRASTESDRYGYI